mgnify:CR=1 FL=1
MDKLSFWGNSDDLVYFARNGVKLRKGYKEREADEIREIGCWGVDEGPNAVFNVGGIIYVVFSYSFHGTNKRNGCWRIGVTQTEQGVEIPDSWDFQYEVYDKRKDAYSMLLNIRGVEEGIEVD